MAVTETMTSALGAVRLAFDAGVALVAMVVAVPVAFAWSEGTAMARSVRGDIAPWDVEREEQRQVEVDSPAVLTARSGPLRNGTTTAMHSALYSPSVASAPGSSSVSATDPIDGRRTCRKRGFPNRTAGRHLPADDRPATGSTANAVYAKRESSTRR